MSIALVHGRFATALVLFTLTAGVYGLIEYWRNRLVNPGYWGLIVTGSLIALGQALLGAWLALRGMRPTEWIHVVYGVLIVLWAPLLVLLNRNRAERSRTLMCALVSLIEFAIALQAWNTA